MSGVGGNGYLLTKLFDGWHRKQLVVERQKNWVLTLIDLLRTISFTYVNTVSICA